MNITHGSIGSIIGPETLRAHKTRLWHSINRSLQEPFKPSKSLSKHNKSVDHTSKFILSTKLKRNSLPKITHSLAPITKFTLPYPHKPLPSLKSKTNPVTPKSSKIPQNPPSTQTSPNRPRPQNCYKSPRLFIPNYRQYFDAAQVEAKALRESRHKQGTYIPFLFTSNLILTLIPCAYYSLPIYT